MINKKLFVAVFCLLLVSPYSVAGEWVSDPINGCKVWSDDRADARKGKEIIPDLKRSRSVVLNVKMNSPSVFAGILVIKIMDFSSSRNSRGVKPAVSTMDQYRCMEILRLAGTPDDS